MEHGPDAPLQIEVLRVAWGHQSLPPAGPGTGGRDALVQVAHRFVAGISLATRGAEADY